MRLPMKKDKKCFGPSSLTDESGFALSVTVILLTVLLLLVALGAQWAAQDIKRTATYKNTRQAFYIAETGIQQAVNFFNYDGTGSSPGAAGDGFDQELDGSNWPTAFASTAFGGGIYTVTITDNDDNDSNTNDDIDNTVILISQGTRNNETMSIEAIISRPLYTPEYAIITDGDLKVAGSSAVTGGGVHTNSDFTQSGSPTISGGATASGTCTDPLCTDQGVDQEFVPVVEPTDYENFADYIFNTDATIDRRLVDGSLQTGVEGESIFSAFSHNAQGWSIGGGPVIGTDVPNQAILYFKEKFKAQSIGSVSTPWEITIITEEDIEWTGNAFITNWQDPNDSPDIQNLFLIAENDIKINSMDQDTQGIICAKDQFSIGGTATLSGFIIGGNLTTSSNVVNGTESSIQGSMTLAFNSSLVPPVLSDKVAILAWQEQ